MSYITEKNALHKRPVTLVDIVLDFCALTWNVGLDAPGAGTVPCYNTYPTCVYNDGVNPLKFVFDKTTKTYQFCKTTDPLINDTVRPYIVSVSDLPQKVSNKIAVKQRITIEMIDEPDTDVGVDPYYANRAGYTTPALIPGTFWKKLLERNSNYKGKAVKVKEGFEGMLEADFQITFVGTINNITSQRGKVKIECVDIWKALEDTKYPAKITAKLLNEISGAQLTFVLDCETSIPLPASNSYLKIDNEIIFYYSFTPATKTIVVSSGNRGYAGTTAEAHSVGAKVENVHVFFNDPYLLMADMLQKAGVNYSTSTSLVTSLHFLSTQLQSISPYIGCVITTPTPLSALFWEIADLFSVKAWIEIISGLAYVSVRSDILTNSFISGSPSYVTAMPQINDDAIIKGSLSKNENETSRYTHFIIYYNTAIGVTVDQDSAINTFNGQNGDRDDGLYYGVVEKIIKSRWFNGYNFNFGSTRSSLSYYFTFMTNYLGLKTLAAHADANTQLTFETELKNELYLAAFAKVTTKEVIDIYGLPITDQVFQVIEKNKTGLIKYKYLLEKVISYS